MVYYTTMEIEAKYRIDETDLATLANLRHLGPYTLVPAPAPEVQENIYYDTADGRLSAARCAIRVRRIGAQSLITLKGPTENSQNGVHRRAEFEFPGADPDPQAWPPGAARDQALALTGGMPLLPRVVIHTERQVLQTYRDDAPVAEVCLDRSVVRSGDREISFSELEIELKEEGAWSDLERLTRELAAYAVLTPEPRTKLERALGLLERRDQQCPT